MYLDVSLMFLEIEKCINLLENQNEFYLISRHIKVVSRAAVYKTQPQMQLTVEVYKTQPQMQLAVKM